jgi:hypothetical protein
MSYFKFIVLMTHPKLTMPALPLFRQLADREGRRLLADVG